MRRLLVGTAGHVDHGKTRLVEALTGIDCDRWAEEKRRGITIDLGFAHCESGDAQVGFIDVPGHEKLLHNALAGLGAIDLLLLVIAADEGIRPQTREHLLVATLLGVPAAIVALTKVDAVDEDLADLRAIEVAELLAPTPFAGASVTPVSAVTGQGIDALRADLEARARSDQRPGAAARPARLPLDRAFHLPGKGVVATGTLVAGQVRRGDTLALWPGAMEVKVRSLQVHGEDRAEAFAGERTAVQVTGVERDELERGHSLAAPGSMSPSRHLLVRWRRVAPEPAVLDDWIPIRLHAHTSALLGRLRPLAPASLPAGAEGVAEIRLDEPLAAWRGDRFLVRRPSPSLVLGGGEILDPAWSPPPRRELAAAIAAIAGEEASAVARWIHDAGPLGRSAAEIDQRLGRPEATRILLDDLTAAGIALRVPAGASRPPRWIAASVLRERAATLSAWLAEHREADRFAEGAGKPEAIRRLVGVPLRGHPDSPVAAEIGEALLRGFAHQSLLQVVGDRVFPPGARNVGDADRRLSRAVEEAFAQGGLQAPSPGEVAARLAARPQIVEGLVRALLRQGALVRLAGDLIVARSAAIQLEKDLRATGWTRFRVPQFKEHFGLPRKWAIPWLEHLDGRGVTRRSGDEREVLPARPTIQDT